MRDQIKKVLEREDIDELERLRDAHDYSVNGDDRALQGLGWPKLILHPDELAELDRLGLRPAFYAELYAYSRSNPDAGLEFPIVALGDTALLGRVRNVAYVYRGGYRRALDLCGIVSDWSYDGRFLATEKDITIATA